MKVTNDIHTRAVPGFAEEMAVRRLENAVRNADRVVPAPPAEPAALAQLSILAFRILRGFWAGSDERRMNATSDDVSLLAMSLDHARMGLDAARAQQPAAAPGNPAPAVAETGVVLELSAAAQALMSTWPAG